MLRIPRRLIPFSSVPAARGNRAGELIYIDDAKNGPQRLGFAVGFDQYVSISLVLESDPASAAACSIPFVVAQLRDMIVGKLPLPDTKAEKPGLNLHLGLSDEDQFAPEKRADTNLQPAVEVGHPDRHIVAGS